MSFPILPQMAICRLPPFRPLFYPLLIFELKLRLVDRHLKHRPADHVAGLMRCGLYALQRLAVERFRLRILKLLDVLWR